VNNIYNCEHTGSESWFQNAT